MISRAVLQTALKTDGSFRSMEKTVYIDMLSNDREKNGIMDWNGNTIWEAPYRSYSRGFDIKLLYGISHIMLEFTPRGVAYEEGLGSLITGKGFVYDCRHPGLFVDSYQDYILKNRDYDITMRKLQSDRQERQAWFSVAENAGFGMAFGSSVGLAAAGIGGVIESVGTTLLNNTFDPKIQAAKDKFYGRMTDQISLVGDSITNLQYYKPFYKYILKMDESNIERMKNDIEQNGYYCDEITDKLYTYFTDQKHLSADDPFTVNPVIQADNVVVEGACNVIGKHQVVKRLLDGVEFI